NEGLRCGQDSVFGSYPSRRLVWMGSGFIEFSNAKASKATWLIRRPSPHRAAAAGQRPTGLTEKHWFALCWPIAAANHAFALCCVSQVRRRRIVAVRCGSERRGRTIGSDTSTELMTCCSAKAYPDTIP